MSTDPRVLVLRDLLDAAVAEDLAGAGRVRPGSGPDGRPGTWVRLLLPDGRCLAWRARAGGVLQTSRYVDGPVLVGVPGEPLRETTDPAEVLELLAPDAPCEEIVARDLGTAVGHVLDVSDPSGEVLAAVRGRPFHPTARAVAGWSRAELDRWGPGREVALDWVGVRRDHVRHGTGGPVVVDGAPEAPDGYEALPVHPFDRERVLPVAFGRELADGTVVPLARGVGSGTVTSSLRTLDLGGDRHLKLPLGVTTLGSARLLGARSLDHGQRGEQVLRRVLAADPALAARVAVADESAWSGFAAPDGSDEFHDRPGHLAAALRRLPPCPDGAVRLPLAALAAPAWDGVAGDGAERSSTRGALTGLGDPAGVFGEVVEAVVEVGIGFLRHGVLPEMHGQNVLVELAGDGAERSSTHRPGDGAERSSTRRPGDGAERSSTHRPGDEAARSSTRRYTSGRVVRVVLRDHDAVRVHPRWLSVPDPAYRLAPGGTQSLRLDTPAELIGFFCTLTVEVGLGGVVDALVRATGEPEPRWWSVIRHAVEGAVDRTRSPVVRQALRATLLDAETWPYRTVLRPLLERGPSRGASMPAGTTRVPNPLRAVP
ncbi:IucA/IucC family protein [Actinomycetospora lemnae]|uniref:IucA/IucC family protein n=1 Tax=Actinomycetospora lemnae TaxID=3019891 RepID=A0ABT5SWX0_9PSEU|nr:IucA/IucC family protein [Actinomycetospora sp. DW7H6]MDD7967221.1 IucA/IucC family protein [Actinomycetospora sp. DW7H6]